MKEIRASALAMAELGASAEELIAQFTKLSSSGSEADAAL
jgi:hypothetical protein